jgi:PAS domain S-box-containing protein
MLKNAISQRMYIEGKSSSSSSSSSSILHPDFHPVVSPQSPANFGIKSPLEKADFLLIQAIQSAQRSFIITDPYLPDNPIIFASKGFLDLCGYQLEEVLGRNCRFLQGPGTDRAQVEVMRKGIESGIDVSVCLLNYRADGSEFFNQVFVAALRDSNQKIINFVGVQVEV